VRRSIGVALQDAGLARYSTGREHVDMMARLFGMSRRAARERAAELLELFDLTEAADRLVRSYSGGMRRRLDLACGLVHQPRLLILDEPTTGVDPTSRAALWEELRRLQRAGTSLLLTTHYLEEAERLADRVAVIAGGRIVAVGTPDELGGRATAASTVAWAEDGARRRIETYEPTRLVAELSTRFGGEVPELTVERPTLEDVYLRMIGAVERAEREEATP